jgi:hypothetical protein
MRAVVAGLVLVAVTILVKGERQVIVQANSNHSFFIASQIIEKIFNVVASSLIKLL